MAFPYSPGSITFLYFSDLSESERKAFCAMQGISSDSAVPNPHLPIVMDSEEQGLIGIFRSKLRRFMEKGEGALPP